MLDGRGFNVGGSTGRGIGFGGLTEWDPDDAGRLIDEWRGTIEETRRAGAALRGRARSGHFPAHDRGAGPPGISPPDAGLPDAGLPGAGLPGASPPGVSPPDAGPPDASPLSAGPSAAGRLGAGPPDAGPLGAEAPTVGLAPAAG